MLLSIKTVLNMFELFQLQNNKEYTMMQEWDSTPGRPGKTLFGLPEQGKFLAHCHGKSKSAWPHSEFSAMLLCQGLSFNIILNSYLYQSRRQKPNGNKQRALQKSWWEWQIVKRWVWLVRKLAWKRKSSVENQWLHTESVIGFL